jgi:hypothetical protein
MKLEALILAARYSEASDLDQGQLHILPNVNESLNKHGVYGVV